MAQMMKAAVFEAPKKVVVKQVPVPEIGPGEVPIVLTINGRKHELKKSAIVISRL